MAPKVAKATAEVQGLHPWVELGASGKENSEKTEKECHLAVQASLFSDKRSSFSSETGVTDDVALWKLQCEQRRAPGVLPSVQSTLVPQHGRDQPEDREAKVLGERTLTSRSRTRSRQKARRVGTFSQQMSHGFLPRLQAEMQPRRSRCRMELDQKSCKGGSHW